ncbi:MAG TPA: transcription elongation factor GreAB [Verrucomicrobiae bacterium]
MNKRTLVEKIVAQLRGEAELYAKAARAAHAEATHESSKAENKYDTRGLEASYLAHGQAKQAAETAQAVHEFASLFPRHFKDGDAIDVGALVELKSKSHSAFYFVGPRAGGTEVVEDGKEILVITPQSPLGSQLIGQKQGAKIKLTIAGSNSEFRIASVL